MTKDHEKVRRYTFRHSELQFKDTVERLESAFRSAVYRGTYGAIVLEKECQDRLHT